MSRVCASTVVVECPDRNDSAVGRHRRYIRFVAAGCAIDILSQFRPAIHAIAVTGYPVVAVDANLPGTYAVSIVETGADCNSVTV